MRAKYYVIEKCEGGYLVKAFVEVGTSSRPNGPEDVIITRLFANHTDAAAFRI